MANSKHTLLYITALALFCVLVTACSLFNEQGHVQGRGVSQFQYTFPLSAMDLEEDELLYVKIRHDMKRDILPGISDVGLRVVRSR